MANKYWYVQERVDREPVAVLALIDGDFLPRRFVPGEGLVDWPGATGYVMQGEIGAHPIDEATARRLMARGVGKVRPQILAQARGKAATIPVDV